MAGNYFLMGSLLEKYGKTSVFPDRGNMAKAATGGLGSKHTIIYSRYGKYNKVTIK